jgi:hypothetical protein
MAVEARPGPRRPAPPAGPEPLPGWWWPPRVAGWALLLFQFQQGVGLLWDERWHQAVGRDRFLTPPHLLLYSGVALSGITCLVMVVWATLRHRRGAGVDDGNSVPVLGLFHAPLGFVVTGCGCLVVAAAAPLDDYWHQLYGLDVALWAPFHLMALTGGFLALLGSAYLWAALAVQARRAGRDPRAERASTAFALMLLVGLMVNLAQPGLVLYPIIELGPVSVMTYPVLLAAMVPWLLVAARRALGWRRAASLVALVLFVQDVVLNLTIPAVVRSVAAAEGLPFRSPALAPTFRFQQLLPSAIVLLVAVLLDRVAAGGPPGRPRRPVVLGATLGLALWPLAALAGQVSATAAARLAPGALPPGLFVPPPATTLAVLLALPCAVALAAASATVGDGFGQVLGENPR